MPARKLSDGELAKRLTKASVDGVNNQDFVKQLCDDFGGQVTSMTSRVSATRTKLEVQSTTYEIPKDGLSVTVEKTGKTYKLPKGKMTGKQIMDACPSITPPQVRDLDLKEAAPAQIKLPYLAGSGQRGRRAAEIDFGSLAAELAAMTETSE